MRAAAGPVVMVAAVVVALGAGCGAQQEGEGPEGVEPPPVAEGPATSLEVTVWPTGRGNGPEHVTTLECDPIGGTHPAPEEACLAIGASPDALEPLPDDVICTQEYGGPEQARVRGIADGREVDLEYNRGNGCEIARWDALSPLFRVVIQ